MVIKFEPNIPLTLAFTYTNGRKDESGIYKNQDGTPQVQFFRKTLNGDSVYLAPYVEAALVKLGYSANEQVTICKRVSGKVTCWDVSRPGEAPNRPLAGQPAPATRANSNGGSTATPRAPQTPSGTISTVMKTFLKEAVDLTKYTVDYAVSLGFPMPPDMLEVVQKIAVSLYIQHGKEGNIRRMHDNQEALQHSARNGSDADFRQAGSQAAADAVAKRKLEEEENEPPPAWSREITDDDIPF